MCLLECLRVDDGNGGGNGGGVEYLAEDLVIGILMRLPAEHLWRCRRVCKRWKALISSPDFAQAHLQQSTSSASFVSYQVKKVNFYSLPAGTPVMNRVFNGSFVKRWKHQMRGELAVPLASCNGLILFRSRVCVKEIYIGNPVTGELITLTNLYWGRYRFCGFFYHSTTQEYKLLRFGLSECHDGFLYVVSTLGSGEFGSTEKKTRFAKVPYRIRDDSSPAILDNAVYWMIAETGLISSTCENFIMMFSMDSEEFRTLRHPGNLCPTRELNERFTLHERMKLLQMEGRLACLFLSGKVGDLWVFEFSNSDSYTGHWSRIYRLDFDSNSMILPLDFPDHRIKFTSIIRNTELLLVWHGTGIEESDYNWDLWLAGYTYTKSVVSLKNIYPCCVFYPKSKWNRFISKIISSATNLGTRAKALFD